MLCGKESLKGIIDLYSKIPEYSQVKHLGNADFVNKVETLKEEFRLIRSKLNEDIEVELLSESTKNGLYITSKGTKSQLQIPPRKVLPILDKFKSAFMPLPNILTLPSLSIKTCEIHPYLSSIVVTSNNSMGLPTEASPNNYCPATPKLLKAKLKSSLWDDKWSSGNRLRALSYKNIITRDSPASSEYLSDSSHDEFDVSRRRKEYHPPKNTQIRYAINVSHPHDDKNDEASSLVHRQSRKNAQIEMKVGKSSSHNKSETSQLKAHPVPDCVSKSLYDQIMTKNRKRSDKVREQSKNKLMSQMKPFSFSKVRQTRKSRNGQNSQDLTQVDWKFGKVSEHKQQKLGDGDEHFKAKPAPSRTQALMAALRMKEQQEYRELKKQLRMEALMKMSSIPPGLDSRTQKQCKILPVYYSIASQKQGNLGSKNRRRTHLTSNNRKLLESESSSDEGNTTVDSTASSPLYKKHSREKFSNRANALYGSLPSGLSDILGRSHKERIFESTSHENNASRLRVRAVKKKEEERIQRQTAEDTRASRNEQKRYRLRSYHSDVWRRACSYSAIQDIQMRRELRFAAAILERENYRKEMSTMLNRVRSAPLLLEGIRERTCLHCKQHGQPVLISQFTEKKTPSKTKELIRETSAPSGIANEHDEDSSSETIALAEGNLSNSDNESSIFEPSNQAAFEQSVNENQEGKRNWQEKEDGTKEIVDLVPSEDEEQEMRKIEREAEEIINYKVETTSSILGNGQQRAEIV